MKRSLLFNILLFLSSIGYAYQIDRQSEIICNHFQNCGGNSQAPVQTVPTISYRDYYLAIARGLSYRNYAIFGWGVQQLSESKAKRKAIADCKQQGGHDCKIVQAGHNGCIGLLYIERADNGVEMGPITGANKSAVYRNAVKFCRNDDKVCQLDRIECSIDPSYWHQVNR